MRDQHRLKARAYDKGDYDAIVILLDLMRARFEAGLTERQKEALFYVYDLDMRQIDAAEAMGVTREAIAQFVRGAQKRILKVYERWTKEAVK